jgi:RNA polymerase primary sigma factor
MHTERQRKRSFHQEMFAQASVSAKERGGEQDLYRQYYAEVGQKRVLARTREVELAQVKDAGDAARNRLAEGNVSAQQKRALATVEEAGIQARNALVEANLRLVVLKAQKYSGNGLPFLDLIHIGNEALIESVDKYDYQTGFRVGTFAGRNIEWGIRKALAQEGRLVRYPMNQHEQLPAFEKLHQHFPDADKLSDAEIASKMGVSEPVARDLRELAHYTLEPLYDSAPSPSLSPEAVLYTHQRDKKIHERVQALPQKERVIIQRRYGFDGKSEEIVPLRQLASEQGISFGEVRLREIKAFMNLEKALREL